MNVIKLSHNILQDQGSSFIKGILSVDSNNFNYQDMLTILKLVEDAADKIIDDYILANKPKKLMAHPGGRPPHFKTDQELQDKIQEYFDSGCNTKEIYIKVGKDEFEPREMKIPTITGLTLFLGFADRRSFYDYENNEEFSHTIKRARTLIEQEYEEMLRTNPTGAIFALKNFNRTDKQEINQTTTNLNLNKDVSELSDEELLAYIKS